MKTKKQKQITWDTLTKQEIKEAIYTLKKATPVEKVKIIDGRKYQLVEE